MMNISKSIYLVALLTTLSFASFGVEGSRTLKKNAKKTSKPTPPPNPEPTSSPTPIPLPTPVPPLNSVFSDVSASLIEGGQDVGQMRIIFAKGEFQPPRDVPPISATLAISLEVTSASFETEKPTAETVISTAQFCLLETFEGGCVIFQGSSSLDSASSVVPRIAAASSSSTGVIFYGQDIFIDIKEYDLVNGAGLEFTILFTASLEEVTERAFANLAVSQRFPDFFPPESTRIPPEVIGRAAPNDIGSLSLLSAIQKSAEGVSV